MSLLKALYFDSNNPPTTGVTPPAYNRMQLTPEQKEKIAQLQENNWWREADYNNLLFYKGNEQLIDSPEFENFIKTIKTDDNPADIRARLKRGWAYDTNVGAQYKMPLEVKSIFDTPPAAESVPATPIASAPISNEIALPSSQEQWVQNPVTGTWYRRDVPSAVPGYNIQTGTYNLGGPIYPPPTPTDKDSSALYNFNKLQRQLEKPSDATSDAMRLITLGYSGNVTDEGIRKQKILQAEVDRILREHPNIRIGTYADRNEPRYVRNRYGDLVPNFKFPTYEGYVRAGGSWDLYHPGIAPKGTWRGLAINEDYSHVKPKGTASKSTTAKPPASLKFEVNQVYTFADRPNSLYKMGADGKMYIKNKDTGNKFAPITENYNERVSVLRKGLASGKTKAVATPQPTTSKSKVTTVPKTVVNPKSQVEEPAIIPETPEYVQPVVPAIPTANLPVEPNRIIPSTTKEQWFQNPQTGTWYRKDIPILDEEYNIQTGTFIPNKQYGGMYNLGGFFGGPGDPPATNGEGTINEEVAPRNVYGRYFHYDDTGYYKTLSDRLKNIRESIVSPGRDMFEGKPVFSGTEGGYYSFDEGGYVDDMENMEDMFSDAQKALNKKSKEKHNKKYFQGPSSPQNVNTDTYGEAKKSMFIDYLRDNVEDVNEQRSLEILRNAYEEATGMPPTFNLGGNFYDNYDAFGTFGLNPIDPTIGSWSNAYQQDRPGRGFLQDLMGFGTDFGKSMVMGKLQGPKTKVKQRQYYRSGEDDGLGGKQFDPKAYGIFGKARAKDETGDYLYGVGDIFNKERIQGRRLAKEFQRGARQDLKADLAQARRDMSYSPWWNRSEANLQQRDLLREQKRDIKDDIDDMINWRRWEDVPNHGPLSQDNTSIETTNQNTNTSDIGMGTGVSDLLTNPWAMKKDMYGRPVDANGNLLNPLRPYGQYGMSVRDQFGGMIDPRKWMYHMGGNLPPHNHSSSAQNMSDMVTADGQPIWLEGYNNVNPNDPLNKDAFTQNRWYVGSRTQRNRLNQDLVGDVDHWQSFSPNWGGDSPLPGTEKDAMPKIPGVTGYWSIPPGTYHYPEGQFKFYPEGPKPGFEQYWANRKPWMPSASQVVDEATDPSKGKGKGTGKGTGAGAGAGAGTGDNAADPMADYNAWLAQQAEKAGNTVADGLGNVTDVVGGGAGFQFPGAGFPGYIEIAPGVRALSWGPNTNVETFSSDTKYGLFGGRPRRKNVYMTFGTALPGSPNNPDVVAPPVLTPQELVEVMGAGPSPLMEATAPFMNQNVPVNPYSQPTQYMVNENMGGPGTPLNMPTITMPPAPGVAPWAGEDEGMGRRKLFRGRRAESMDEVPTRRGYIPTQQYGGMYMNGGMYPAQQPIMLSEQEIADILAAGGAIKYI